MKKVEDMKPVKGFFTIFTSFTAFMSGFRD